MREMSQRQAASGQFDRAVNPADGVGSLKQVPKVSIAKILGVSRTAMYHFINSRKLDSNASQPQQSRAHRRS